MVNHGNVWKRLAIFVVENNKIGIWSRNILLSIRCVSVCVVRMLVYYGRRMVFFGKMEPMEKEDYEIEFHKMCRRVLGAISSFKKATGVERCCVETTDFCYDEELDEGSGKFANPGRKLGITVYIGEDADSMEDDDE